jgi:hypothetical protein
MLQHRQEMSRQPESGGSLEPIVGWQTCAHDFRFFFGPIKKCRRCGATVAASVDGTPHDIWPPPPANH